MNPQRERLLLQIIIALCVAPLSAQKAPDTSTLVGNWLYSLGPKALFGLHLERDAAKPEHLRGYIVTPENFSFNSMNGTLLQFSQ